VETGFPSRQTRRIHDFLLCGFKPGELLDDLTLSRNQDPVRQSHYFRQIRRDHDHRFALVGKLVDQFMNLDNGSDVDATRGFVENDQLRILDQ